MNESNNELPLTQEVPEPQPIGLQEGINMLTHEAINEAVRTGKNHKGEDVVVVGQVSAEQLASWEQKHGAKYVHTLYLPHDDSCTEVSVAYVREPKVPDYRRLQPHFGTDTETKAQEEMLANCFLGGDERVKELPKLFISIAQWLVLRMLPTAAALKKSV